jgi:hypothetical protein
VRRSELPGYKEFLAYQRADASAAAAVVDSGVGGVEDAVLTAEDAAELVIGLMFAAHKNPAIGAGQTLLFLLDPANKVHLDKVKRECVGGCVDAGSVGEAANTQYHHLDRCITEALRITAHSIGAVWWLGIFLGRNFHWTYCIPRLLGLKPAYVESGIAPLCLTVHTTIVYKRCR